jgi:glutathione S-transferase
MKLYYVPRTRATRPRWLLEELAVPYELVRLDREKQENRAEPYLRINPLGHVPALEDGEVRIIESAAICLYLADKYAPQGFAPPPSSPLRAEYYQWIVFAMVTLEPPVATVYYNTMRPDLGMNPELVPPAKARFAQVAPLVEQHVSGREYAVGQTFTAADVVLGAVVDWATRLGLTGQFPAMAAYGKRMLSRPAAKRAWTD